MKLPAKYHTFLFHPLEKTLNSKEKFTASLIVCALTAITGGLFLIPFAYYQWSDRKIQIKQTSKTQNKLQKIENQPHFEQQKKHDIIQECKAAHFFIDSSDNKDDKFASQLLKMDQFPEKSAELIKNFNRIEKNPIPKMQDLSKELDKFIKYFLKPHINLPDGWQMGLDVAIVIGASISLSEDDLSIFKKYFNEEKDFTQFDSKTKTEIKSGQSKEYYQWSKFYTAFGAIEYFSKEQKKLDINSEKK